MKKHIDLTRGSVEGHVLRMTPPMTVAFFSMMAFNLADTWFVSRLGTQSLAAMGFTFPIVMVFYSIAMGIGLGTSSCVSRAIGAQDYDRVQHLTTYSLLLTLGIMCLLAFFGRRYMPEMLTVLGAEANTKQLAMKYMRVWFLFAPAAALPLVGNNAISATGDTLWPGIIISSAAVLNVIMDPILIFGWGPIPAMGITGAALATGLTHLLTVGWAFLLIHYKCHLLTMRWTGLRKLLGAWGSVLQIAIPSAATNLLMPVTMGIVTRMISGFGEVAVAATAVGQRIEHFTYLLPMAMGSTLVPIIGQNWGAKRVDRAHEAWVKTNWYGIAYAVLCLGLAIPLAAPVARLFSRDPEVIRFVTHYLWIILTGAILQHPMVYTGFAFNAIQKPLHASLLTVIRLAGLTLPMAYLGSHLLGVYGVYLGISAATILASLLALTWFSKTVRGAM